MDVKDLARLSQYHYQLKNKPTKKNHKELEKMFPGYKVSPSSDHNVLGIYHPEKKQLVINHRGTSKGEDVLSDTGQLLGLSKSLDPQYNSRRKHTKQMIKDHKDVEHTTLTGHSFGGDTVMNALHKSPSLAKHIDKVHVFNPFNVSKYKRDEELKKKITIHRTKDDVVSIMKQPYKTIIHKTGDLNPLEAHKLDHFI